MTPPEGFAAAYRRCEREPANALQLQSLLALVGYDAPPSLIESWPLDKRVQLEVYAVNVHLRASDNILRKHPRPEWLPEPWCGEVVGKGAFEGPGGTKVP